MNLDQTGICFLYLIVNLTIVVESYKFLGIIHTDSISHYIFGSTLMKALAEKGHEVHVISQYQLKERNKNYHEVPIDSVKRQLNEYQCVENACQNSQNSYTNIVDTNELILNDFNVQRLMASNQTFDAVICEMFYSEALYGLSEHFGAPLIGLSTFGSVTWDTNIFGSPSPPSYVPHSRMQATDKMSFIERFINTIYVIQEKLYMDYIYFPKQAALYKKYFPHLKRDLYAVRKNAAAVLINTHVSLSYPRPYVPNQIQVGGLHINRQRAPLPKDLEDFINEATHGVIYFAMGTSWNYGYMKEADKLEFVRAFTKLKQRVLWKIEDPSQKGRHGNIYIKDWFPQDDVLAHKNVKLFITHGGFLSLTESIYHAKPVIGLPLFGDQFANMLRAQSAGIGIKLNFSKFKAKHLIRAVDRIIHNKSYTERVHEMSAIYKDQPMLPLDLAVYWVEYLARHKGAKHLRSAGLNLDFIKYYNIDAIIILSSAALLVLYVLQQLLHSLLREIVKKCVSRLKFKKTKECEKKKSILKKIS